MERRQIQAVIALIFELGLAITIIALKFIYYITQYQREYFHTFAGFAVWTLISIVISIVPLMFLIKASVEVITRNEIYENYAVELAQFIAWAVLNVFLEVASVLGAGMNLDESWMNIAMKMVVIQLLTFIPFILMKLTKK
jgi:hypothetical protein